MNRALIDISPPLSPAIAVWPGDTPLSRDVLCDMRRGDTITLSTLKSTVHLGSHADGPNHYSPHAPGIGERSLESYIGPCHVVDAAVSRSTRVGLNHISQPAAGWKHPRVLIRTGTFPNPEHFNEDFAAIEPALIEHLADRGVRLIGIDTPSVDLFTSKDLPAHNAFLRRDVSILEGLVLSGVAPGEYELIALPLRLVGFDASPVRAVLRPMR
jgi:arylformamidase